MGALRTIRGRGLPHRDDRFSDVSVLLSLADKVNGLRNPEFDTKVADGT
jgi:hypothetical protein